MRTKKITVLILLITISFFSGFAFKTMLMKQDATLETGKVTGIGGIFFKCKDPKKVKEWYKTHLGFEVNAYGAVFEWRQGADSTQKGFTQWSPFNEKTKYFEPSTKDFMINYRVENLENLIDKLRSDSVTILDTIETVSYGKFVHILDIEGNKIELWEPNDIEFDKLGKEIGAKTIK